jgi:thioredoxin 1
MQNWDDELNEIMAKKKQDLAKQSSSGNSNNSDTGVTSKVAISKPVTLDDNNFTESVNKYPLIVVDFWAPWCGPCRMVGPVIEQLAGELAGKVVFGKLNVDESPVTSNTFGIQSIPTLAIFKDGKAVDGMVGAASKSQILSKISTYIDGAPAS